MIRRRTSLKLVALALLASNAVWFGYRYYGAGETADITYVGLDSMGMPIPESQPAMMLKDGKWQPDPAADSKVNVPTLGFGGRPRPLTIVSLAPKPTYGRFIKAVRYLRARRICNFALRQDKTPDKANMPFTDSAIENVASSAFVLCGYGFGDAGFSGELPPDGEIRL